MDRLRLNIDKKYTFSGTNRLAIKKCCPSSTSNISPASLNINLSLASKVDTKHPKSIPKETYSNRRITVRRYLSDPEYGNLPCLEILGIEGFPFYSGNNLLDSETSVRKRKLLSDVHADPKKVGNVVHTPDVNNLSNSINKHDNSHHESDMLEKIINECIEFKVGGGEGRGESLRNAIYSSNFDKFDNDRNEIIVRGKVEEKRQSLSLGCNEIPEGPNDYKEIALSNRREDERIESSVYEHDILESEINYTQSDINFFTYADEELVTEPREIPYATPVATETYDTNILNLGTFEKKSQTSTDLCEPLSTSSIEFDDDLYEYVEELSKETIQDDLSPSSSEETLQTNFQKNGKESYLISNNGSDDYSETNLETFESDLNDAIKESVDSNTITPIIKKELQYKIQCQRLERGEDELQPECNEPRIYKLTDEEILKRNARREQNRRSAKKGRLRAKQRERDLAKILNRASASISELTIQARALRAQRNSLLQELTDHLGVCLNSKLVDKQKTIIASLAS